jgi:hypothetical protein
MLTAIFLSKKENKYNEKTTFIRIGGRKVKYNG